MGVKEATNELKHDRSQYLLLKVIKSAHYSHYWVSELDRLFKTETMQTRIQCVHLVIFPVPCPVTGGVGAVVVMVMVMLVSVALGHFNGGSVNVVVAVVVVVVKQSINTG